MEGFHVADNSQGSLPRDVSSYGTEILDPDQQSLRNGGYIILQRPSVENLTLNGLLHNDNDKGVMIDSAVAMVSPVETIQQAEEEEEEDGRDDELCRWGPLRPECCQRFRNAKTVLICLCLLAIVQGMVVNGFVSVVISTIERRFDLTSTQTGFVASGYDIASVLCLIPISYFGGNGNKPRWIVCGIFLLSLGSFLFALPHFLIDKYSYSMNAHRTTCDVVSATQSHLATNGSNGSDSDRPCGAALSHYMYVLVVAQMLHGAGATPLYTLAVTYLDENLKAKLTPVYLGIFYSTAIIGPAVGYILGGQLLKFYVDVGRVDSNEYRVSISPEDPQWVGAWWIGFLISGTLAFLLAIPFCGFPRALPGSARLRRERVSEVHRGSEERSETIDSNRGFSLSLKEIPASLKILFSNPTFMSLSLAGACEGLLVSGFIVFAPKFVESQFSISAAWAAQLIGLATIPSGGGGTFFGGYLVKRLNLKCLGILRLCIFTTCTSLVLTLCMLARCQNIDFVGVNTEYSHRDRALNVVNLTSFCNIDCMCSMEHYKPVCGADNLTYFSSCHAGCAGISTGGQKVYQNCSCIATMLAEGDVITDAWAVEGKCESSCQQLLAIFLPLFAMIIFVTFVTSMPALSATLRCVPEKQRSFALGIQWMLFRCLGMIPAPVLFGALIDRACLAWQQQPCNSEEKGSCFTYDNWSMGTYFLILVFCCKGLSLLFFVIALFLYRPPLTGSDATTVEACNGNAGNSNAASWSLPSSRSLLNSNGLNTVHGCPPSNDNRENEQTEKDI